MLLNEFIYFDSQQPTQVDDLRYNSDNDTSVLKSKDLRKTRLTLRMLNDLRKAGDAREQEKKDAAEAAALNSYWQPLADAWALNEALIQTIVDGGLSPSTSEGYIQFKQNVNLNYASISKDTYCRIAFSKKGIAIDYEAVQK